MIAIQEMIERLVSDNYSIHFRKHLGNYIVTVTDKSNGAVEEVARAESQILDDAIAEAFETTPERCTR